METLTPYLISEKGSYFHIDSSITYLSLEELEVIKQMVDLVDSCEKE